MRAMPCYSAATNMAKAKVVTKTETDAEEAVLRVYEVGYHIVPTVREEDVETVVAGIRSVIEKAGGTFVSEGAPALTKLAYPMQSLQEGKGKHTEHDRAYFGWIKFESTAQAAQELDEILHHNKEILRSIIFQTIREETRARFKAPTLREVKRGDVIKPTTRRPEASASSAPVSEAEIDKAIDDLTTPSAE